MTTRLIYLLHLPVGTVYTDGRRRFTSTAALLAASTPRPPVQGLDALAELYR